MIAPATVPEVGFIDGLPEREYHRHPALSASGIADLLDSPATYAYFRQHPEARKDTEASAFGALVHVLLLEGEDAFAARHYVTPVGFSRSRKADKEFAEAAEADGRRQVKQDDFDQARRVVDAVLAFPTAREIVYAATARERSMFWAEGGVACRARLDIDAVTAFGLVADLKVRDDPSPSAFRRDRRLIQRATQASFYTNGYVAASLSGGSVAVPDFAWIVAPSEPPYRGRVFVAEPDAVLLAKGEECWRRGVALYRECEQKNDWGRGYGDAPVVISAPSWLSGDDL